MNFGYVTENGVNSNPIQPVAFSPTIFELTFWHIAHILTVAKECGEIP